MRDVLTSEHELFRAQFRRFLEDYVVPHHGDWEKEGVVPKSLWLKAGEMGFLLPTMPPEYGGAGGDFGFSAVMIEETARVNATGLGFTLHNDVAAPYLLEYGSEAVKQGWLPRMARGEIIGAIAMTEPGAGSDLKAIRTTARRDGDEYVINGSKTFITNGMNSGLVIVAVKTAPELGRQGVSLFIVPEGTPGFTKGRKLDKVGLLAQDTAELFFNDVRVPAEYLLGEKNMGFSYLMTQLAQERLTIAVRAIASVEGMLERSISYMRDRKVFDQPLISLQNSKFKLAEVKAYAAMLRVFVDDCLEQHLKGKLTAERAAMAKLVSTELQGRLLDELLQLHGGYGYMNEYVIGPAWRDARVMRLYGGSSEIMKEIISRSL